MKQPAGCPPKITVECSRKSHIVRVGEPFEFVVTADPPRKLQVVISEDGEAVLRKMTVTPPVRIPASLPHPGFVRCAVAPVGSDDPQVLCGVGVDPDQIRPLLPEPADFDEFWARTKRELAAIPPDFRMRKIGADAAFRYYRISCANLNGQRAYAMLSLPADTSAKLPLVVTFPGGEAMICEEDFLRSEPSDHPDLGFPYAHLLFHLPPYRPVRRAADRKARHDEFLREIGLRRYVFSGLADRERFYARTAVAGCLRLLDEALKQPGIDPERVGYFGASHGGGFGLYLAAFSGKFKAAFCGVPNFGDRGGFLAGRHTPDSNSPEYRKHVETLQYFDTAYAARRIGIPVMIGVGFIDKACLPTAVYSIYNELCGPKIILTKIRNGHGDAPTGYHEMTRLWLAKQLTGE